MLKNINEKINLNDFKINGQSNFDKFIENYFNFHKRNIFFKRIHFKDFVEQYKKSINVKVTLKEVRNMIYKYSEKNNLFYDISIEYRYYSNYRIEYFKLSDLPF